MFHRPKQEAQPQEKVADTQKTQLQQAVEKDAETVVSTPEQKEIFKQDRSPEEPKQTINTPVKEETVMSNDKPETEDRSTDAPAGVPFQRPPQMQRSVPGNFAGNYGGAGTSGMMSKEVGEDRRLVIGPGITMSGEIEACDYLLVEGTLEAALKGAKVLEIAETGTFYGAVEIEEATVAGRFEGDLTVNGRLTIKSGGSVTGAVAYKELAIEAGATLDGKVSPLASMGAAQAGKPQQKAMAPKNDNSGESEGGELPFSGNAIAAAE